VDAATVEGADADAACAAVESTATEATPEQPEDAHSPCATASEADYATPQPSTGAADPVAAVDPAGDSPPDPSSAELGAVSHDALAAGDSIEEMEGEFDESLGCFIVEPED
jgi:hypothetical protein